MYPVFVSDRLAYSYPLANVFANASSNGEPEPLEWVGKCLASGQSKQKQVLGRRCVSGLQITWLKFFLES